MLLVDDDPFMLAVLADMLGEEPLRVLSAASGPDALALLAREPVEVILCDQDMPGMRGTDVLARVAARYGGGYGPSCGAGRGRELPRLPPPTHERAPGARRGTSRSIAEPGPKRNRGLADLRIAW